MGTILTTMSPPVGVYCRQHRRRSHWSLTPSNQEVRGGLSFYLLQLTCQTSRFVEKKYKLEIGAAQTTQLSKAIISGSDKGVFVLPKGKLLLSLKITVFGSSSSPS